ncbi:hypothetical protein BH11PSE3_BH11PSE3_40800 [soil metagenome]
MKRLARRGLLLGAGAVMVAGCEERRDNAASVYALIDVSGSYFREIDKAVRTLRVMMGFIRAHDSFAVAEIGACSFTDDAVILRFTAPDRPSERQRLVAAYAQKLAAYATKAKATNFTDIRGALAQAAQQLSTRPATGRTIVLFSDLDEDLPPGCRRDAALPSSLNGIDVIATNVVRLPDDNRDPQRYTRRLDGWRKLVETAGARWQVVPDPADVVALLKDR